MKIIPNDVINGLNNNWEKGFLIYLAGKIEPLWLSTKNIIIMLCDTELPVNYDRLANEIDGNNIDAISNFRSGMDISSGGGYQFITNFSINLLNYDGFNEVLESADLEGCLVMVYMFYIHPGESIVQLSNALLTNIGVINEIVLYDNTKIIIKCISGEYFRHRIIPDNKISEKNYPYAPKSSYGKSIPILYGAFTGTDLKLNVSNLAPAICIDENNQEFVFAKHECKSDSIHCFALSKSHEITDIISNWIYTNSSATSKVRLCDILRCEFILQPGLKGSQLNPDYYSTYKAAVDSNIETSVIIQPNNNFYLKFDGIGNPGTPEIYNESNVLGYFKLCFSFGNIINGSSGKAAKVKYFIDNNFIYLNNYDITASMSNNEVFFLFYFPFHIFYTVLSQMEIGFTTEPGGSVELKNMYIKFRYFPEV